MDFKSISSYPNLPDYTPTHDSYLVNNYDVKQQISDNVQNMMKTSISNTMNSGSFIIMDSNRVYTDDSN